MNNLKTAICSKCGAETQHEMRHIVYARVPSRNIPDHLREKIYFQFSPVDDRPYIPAIIGVNNQSPSLQIWIDDIQHDFMATICIKCHNVMIWRNNKRVYPIASKQELPHTDMPEEIKELYKEAASISALSPRSSCMLLRHIIEKLFRHIGGDVIKENDKLFDMINKLYDIGKIDSRIKEISHCIRLLGNEAAHADIMAIELEDQSEVDVLFKFINLIVDYTISIDNKLIIFQDQITSNKNREKIQ